ncbi:DinB family protein [Algoriphagus lutimaris]|uniref:DinB family protein n=1 Tax=Algoriphagus lutimaris TaxID=613197 RepID=UPI00196ABA09|nr:DinB family protein [Algoriphagus lutimaris]MBN3519476.1 DinB family protein [Algoriphagus lutimaris]
MKETLRIRSLFEKQYDGDPWLGVNFTKKLQQVTPEMAAHKFSPESNSIWEILNHIIGWREVVLQGIPQNGYKSPDHNYLNPIQNPTELEWEHTLVRLKDSQEDWSEFLKNLEKTIFEKPFGDKQYNHYELIMGILHHDIYHLGQISLLIRLVNETNK